MVKNKEFIIHLLAHAGITINGQEPWDVQVHNERVYDRILVGGSLAVGESYMDGWWDVEDMATFSSKILRAYVHGMVFDMRSFFYSLRAKMFHLRRQSYTREHIACHYNTGNDLYMRMLDKRMNYSCGYWRDAHTLDEAQEAKLDLICKKLNIKKGDKILDMGGGFGAFAKYAAEKYGARVVMVTIAKEQADLARELCKGLDVTVFLMDYREIPETEKFDHVVSICMLEHVGPHNHKAYMTKAYNMLKPDGLFLFQSIVGNKSVSYNDPWINKYIFPGGVVPSVEQIGRAVSGSFIIEDWENFGADYDKTLLAWFQNFDMYWEEMRQKYGDRFYRMWRYYLLMCAGSFRARKNQLVQVLLSPKGIKGGYHRL